MTPFLYSYDYDAIGRPATVWRTIPGATNTTAESRFFVTQTYDSVGRPEKTIYPSGFQTINVYNGFGYLKEVRRADSSRNDVYWMADSYAVTGKVNGEYYGNGLANDRTYSDATGRLRTAAVGRGIETTAPFSIQYLQYNYDAVGNVTNRSDSPVNRTEVVQYDGLDRLKSDALTGAAAATVTVAYDASGNITNKSDVGNYVYSYTPSGRSAALPHAVSTAGSASYTYDANGNMLGGNGRTVTWTSFNQVKRVQNTGNTIFSDFTFGAGHERIKEVAHTGTTVFIGSLFERVTGLGGSPLVENKHYIFSPTGRIAVRTERNDTTVDTRYFHTDGLGSITAVTNEAGQIVKRFAFDAWGKRVNPATNGVITSGTSGKFTRGFTDHEQLDDLGLVHMNGRIYDPVLGRFLSADPTVDGVLDAQGFNRYSYVGNNPMNATDPSGYFKLGDALKIAAIVVAGIVTAGAALYGYAALMGGSFVGGLAGAIGSLGVAAGWSGGYAIAIGIGAGFGTSFAGSLLNGGSIGDAFKAGVIGGVVGGVSAGILHGIGVAKFDWFDRGLAHGVVQGGAAEATGGQFRHGFCAGFTVGASEDAIGKWTGEDPSKGIAAAAVVGGTASAIGGGKFANGAVEGAFSYMFNHLSEGLERRQGKIEYQMGSGATDAMMKEAEKQMNQLLNLKMDDGELIVAARMLQQVLNEGYDVVIRVVDISYLPSGRLGDTDPDYFGKASGSTIRYDPRNGGSYHAGHGLYKHVNGLYVLAHELSHAWDHVFHPGIRDEGKAVQVENQVRSLKGYPLTQTYMGLDVVGYDEYVKKNP